MNELKGKRALVTGASSGIGADFARQLAERGLNLVITARRQDRLIGLQSELIEQYGVEVEVLPTDLSEAGAGRALFDATEGAGKPIDVLLNNAGFGSQGAFVEIPWETMAQQIQLNILGLTELSWLFGRAMKERGSGWILNVASIGAYLPAPGYATYAAGKSYVRNFSEALAYELASTGVRVCCLCPGVTATEFMQVAGHELVSWQKGFVMPSARCARIGLRALFGGRRLVVAGVLNTIGMFMLRFLPRRAIVWIASRMLASK